MEQDDLCCKVDIIHAIGISEKNTETKHGKGTFISHGRLICYFNPTNKPIITGQGGLDS